MRKNALQKEKRILMCRPSDSLKKTLDGSGIQWISKYIQIKRHSHRSLVYDKIIYGEKN